MIAGTLDESKAPGGIDADSRLIGVSLDHLRSHKLATVIPCRTCPALIYGAYNSYLPYHN